jgi:anti-sigma factor RsiW
MTCAEMRELIPAHAGDPAASLSLRRHLARCPECKQELAHYEDLLGAMNSLQSNVAAPPAHLTAALMAIPQSPLRERAVVHVRDHKPVYVGAAAVMAAVAGAGAVAWRRRLAAA